MHKQGKAFKGNISDYYGSKAAVNQFFHLLRMTLNWSLDFESMEVADNKMAFKNLPKVSQINLLGEVMKCLKTRWHIYGLWTGIGGESLCHLKMFPVQERTENWIKKYTQDLMCLGPN